MSVDAWAVAKRKILEQLDLRGEFEALGGRPAADNPTSSGWLSVYSIDRDERKPSASLNVVSANGELGYYKDHGAAGKAISFFDLAVKLGKFPDFTAAVKNYAARFEVELPGRPRPGKPKAKSSTQDNCDAGSILDAVVWVKGPEDVLHRIVAEWARRKQGVQFTDALRAGAKPCMWPRGKAAKKCIAFVAVDPSDLKSPRGILLYRADGQEFSPTSSLSARKTHNVGGGHDGVVIAGSADEFRTAEVIWKTEGIPDMLSVASRLPAGHIAFTNIAGAEGCPRGIADAVAGKRLNIVHDADKTGQEGAAKFGKTTAKTAAEVRIVRLPYDVQPKGGKDLRDFFNEGHSAEELLQLAEQAEVVERPADSHDGEGERIKESPLSNAIVEYDEEGKSKTRPKTMNQILADLHEASGDWPRRVGKAVFVDQGKGEIHWLQDAPAFFGWAGTAVGLPRWKDGSDFHTKREAFSEIQRRSTAYQAVELLPHFPEPIPGHYYCSEPPPIGNGSALNELLDRFCFSTPIDRDLFLSGLVTPGWDGPPGTRPSFLITSDAGRGAGKSKNAAMIAHLWGGWMEFSQNEDIGSINGRLLSPDAADKRLAILDNIKSPRFSWTEIESKITSPVISGKRMYVGEGSRPNTITWLITLNGASLSKDMAQRVVVIKIDAPKRTGDWEESTIQFVRDNHAALLGDVREFFTREPMQLAEFSRWATWEKHVLARLPKPSEAQAVIRERQAIADVEAEEADELQDFIAKQLVSLGYDIEADVVFVPSGLAVDWYNAATRDNKRLTGGVRAIKQFHSEGSLPRFRCDESRNYGRGFLWEGQKRPANAQTKDDIESRIEQAKILEEENKENRREARRANWRAR